MSSDPGIEGAVREALSVHVEPPEDAQEALSLKSLELVVLAEDLEARFGFLVAAKEVVPANFGSIAAICAYVARKQGEAR